MYNSWGGKYEFSKVSVIKVGLGCEKVEWDRLVPSGSSRADGLIVLVGEASDFDWPPAHWPMYVMTSSELLGGDRLFGPREAIMHHGEFGGYKYPQANQAFSPLCEIHILND